DADIEWVTINRKLINEKVALVRIGSDRHVEAPLVSILIIHLTVNFHPAKPSMADHSPKSSCAEAQPDGCACADSHAPASSPCTACSVPVRGSASSSVDARYRARRSGGYRNRDSRPPDRR